MKFHCKMTETRRFFLLKFRIKFKKKLFKGHGVRVKLSERKTNVVFTRRVLSLKQNEIMWSK